MTKDLSYYINRFTHLKRDNKNGGAPHKPILLLSLINLFNSAFYKTNEILIAPELVASFKTNWNRLVHTNHHPIFALPFYHMNSEPFWNLIPNFGCEIWIESKGSMRSFSNLTTAVKTATIDQELAALLLLPENRDVLKASILDRYFAETKSNYPTNGLNDFPSGIILQESSEEYKRKILLLKNSVDANFFQEEVFVRSAIFKREIPKIYNNTCAITGMRIDAAANISMVDACHIVPFAQAYDDTLANGIALCPNLHRAFDRGLIAISDQYRVMLSKSFVEDGQSAFNITQFENQQILLPQTEAYFPALENLQYHREKFNF